MADLREEIRARAFPQAPGADAVAVAEAVRAAGGDGVRALVFFGSRKTQARPDAWSAYDLFVVTGPYGRFYRALHAKRRYSRPRLGAMLNAVLPPNQLALPAADAQGHPVLAKCAVVREDSLLRQTSERRKDHFIAGRLFQPTEVLWTADAAAADAVLDALVSAHRVTYRWARPWLPPVFDVEAYCRTLLRVSFAAEIRPEPLGRTDALWQAQEEYLRAVYPLVLAELCAQGELTPVGEGRYSVVHHASHPERWRRRAYFSWSTVRATARWAKYVVTFEGWLEFIVRKARRHTGQEIELTDNEKRMPLVFLWPRVFRYLRHKDGRKS